MRFSFGTFTLFGITLGITAWGIAHVLGIAIWPVIPDRLLFLNLPSLAIVLGGVVAHISISYPISSVLNAAKFLVSLFSQTRNRTFIMQNELEKVLNWHKNFQIKRMALFNEKENPATSEFESYLFLLVSSNYTVDEIRKLVRLKSAERHRAAFDSANLYQIMGNVSPAFGMLGTLFGLIVMLTNFEQNQELAKGLALALMTTLYGLILSQLFFLPLAQKIRHIAAQQFDQDMLLGDAVLLIRNEASKLEIYDRFQVYAFKSAPSSVSGNPALPNMTPPGQNV